MDLTFEHLAEQSRFVALDGDGHQVGEVDYVVETSSTGQPGSQTIVAVTHTGTDPAFRGQGIAGRLTTAVFDAAAELGWRIRPVCPYTVSWVAAHPARSAQVVGG